MENFLLAFFSTFHNFIYKLEDLISSYFFVFEVKCFSFNNFKILNFVNFDVLNLLLNILFNFMPSIFTKNILLFFKINFSYINSLLYLTEC